MKELALEEVVTRSAWLGRDIREGEEWIYRLDADEIAEIDAALRHLQSTGRQIPDIGKEHFPLPRFARTLRLLQTEIENGLGIMVVRGLPRDRYSAEEMGLIYWGIGAHFGRAVAQNAQGDVLGHVRDMGRDQYKDMHARGYQTASLLPFHNDSCDIVGLCCLETAKTGGLSAVASSVAVYNALVRSRPDLVKVLTQPFHADRRGEESEGQKPYYVTPVFIWHKGRMFNRFNRTFIDSAQRFPEVPRLTALQIEALDTIAALCKDPAFRLDMKLERGDMQFVNNYCVLHSRTAYEDHADESKKRHLLRLWLRTSAFVDYPDALRDRYEDMDKWRSSPRPPSYHFIDMAEVTTH
ncbi:MAG: TauD/TfdA family dioxygenase [Pseudomonadota bacterium]